MNSSAQTMMLDVFMLLLIFFLIEPTGVQPTASTDSYEKIIQQPNSGATNQGIKIKRLSLLVKKDAYYVRGQKMSLAAIKTMLINEKIVAIEVSAEPNALHSTVTKVENIANQNHIRIFEVPT